MPMQTSNLEGRNQIAVGGSDGSSLGERIEGLLVGVKDKYLNEMMVGGCGLCFS